MRRTFLRSVLGSIGKWFGLHPEVGDLISGGMRLTNPGQADVPSENLNFASRLIASGIWNYCFFQFYRNFVGPYWVERQYNPTDVSFIPRAVSPLSINVTHRTWMGFRGPASPHFALMDPAGSVSPIAGYYSIEFAIRERGRLYLATRGELRIRQKPDRDLPVPSCEWSTAKTRVRLRATGSDTGSILFVLDYRAEQAETELVISIRPFNPEGATLIHDLAVRPGPGGQVVAINEAPEVCLPRPADRVVVSNLERGDAYFQTEQRAEVHCPHGIGTAALHYRIRGRGELAFAARTYERGDPQKMRPGRLSEVPGLSTMPADKILERFKASRAQWKTDVERGATFRSARTGLNRAARVMSGYLLSLHTGDDMTPGAFTYRTFFFRDAAYMVTALLQWNFIHEGARVVKSYPARQLRNGFFRSQKGEWDSTGQALWTLLEYVRTTGDRRFVEQMYPNAVRAVRWIARMRKKGPGRRLMPPGFSAEHLGPADAYYWDNIWSIAGVRAAAEFADMLGHTADRDRFLRLAEDYTDDLREISEPDRTRLGVLPAAPGRSIETGMIGSICVLYPLELDIFPRKQVRRTVNQIYKRFFNKGLFFHHIIHSGYNVYLSLQVAQCFFRLGEIRKARRILNRVLKKRTDLWTYPEAIHPITGGGVMGDGFHGWAFAELLLLLRRFTVYREQDRLEVFRGLRRRELFGEFEFGPFPLGGSSCSLKGTMNGDGGELLISMGDVSKSGINFVRVHLPTKRGAKVRSLEGAGECRVEGNKLLVVQPGREVRVAFRRD